MIATSSVYIFIGIGHPILKYLLYASLEIGGIVMSDAKKVTASREENTAYINQVLPVKESFDIIQRDILIGGRCASFLMTFSVR